MGAEGNVLGICIETVRKHMQRKSTRITAITTATTVIRSDSGKLELRIWAHQRWRNGAQRHGDDSSWRLLWRSDRESGGFLREIFGKSQRADTALTAAILVVRRRRRGHTVFTEALL